MSPYNSVIALLDSLDEGDRDSYDRVVKTGAKLAVELLADGAAITVPAFRRKLVVRALRLISVPGSQLKWRAASIIDYSARASTEAVLIEAMSNGNNTTRCSVLQLLANIIRNNGGPISNWAELLLLNWWPSDPNYIFEIFDEAGLLPSEGKVAEKLRIAQWQCSVREVQGWAQKLNNPNAAYLPENAVICSGRWQPEVVPLVRSDGAVTELSFTYFGVGGGPELMVVPPSANHEWKLMQAAVKFGKAPSRETLAKFLRIVADLNMLEEALAIEIPWVLSAMLRAAGDGASLLIRASEVEAGDHGDLDLWLAAEGRWNENGITQDELLANFKEFGIPQDIAEHGAPPIAGRRYRPRFDTAVDELLVLVDRAPASNWAKKLCCPAHDAAALPATNG